MGLVFRGHFILGGVFSPVYNTYTPCIHHVYHASEWYTASAYFAIAWNQILNRFIIHFYNLQTDLKTPPSR